MNASKSSKFLSYLKPKLQGILFYGDPHSNWEPLLESVQKIRPHSIVILGDLNDKTHDAKDLDYTRFVLLKLLKQKIDVRIVIGNHDADTDPIFNLIFEEFGSLIFDGSIIELGEAKVKVALLGGIFRGNIWNPHVKIEPNFYSHADWMNRNSKSSFFKGGVGRKHRTSIFPSKFESLRQSEADILITHEAPSTHPFGFEAIDNLAKDLGAKLIVHGHHHQSSEYFSKYTDIAVRALGKAEVWRPDMQHH